MSEPGLSKRAGLASRDFVYHVDAEDRIIFVNAEWLAFAGGNGGLCQSLDSLLGVSIWKFLTDATTYQIYELVMAKVRERGNSITLPFRCDSPDKRRFMELEIKPLQARQLQFSSRLLREEARPTVLLLTSGKPCNDKHLLMCSWCKRVATPEWLEVEDAVLRLRLFDEATVPQITHGICPDCQRSIQKEIDQS